MATKQLIRYECRCEAVTRTRGVCDHTWITRGEGLPTNCPNCLAREHVWNKSEHLVDVRVDEGNDE